MWGVGNSWKPGAPGIVMITQPEAAFPNSRELKMGQRLGDHKNLLSLMDMENVWHIPCSNLNIKTLHGTSGCTAFDGNNVNNRLY